MRYGIKMLGAADLPPEKPRDKLRRLGPTACKDVELVACVFGSQADPDQALTQADQLVADHPLFLLVDLNEDELVKAGWSRPKAQTFVASMEIARRGFAKGGGPQPTIGNPGDALPYLLTIQNADHEHFMVLHLDARNKVTHQYVVSIGTLSSALVHPREVFRRAVQDNAASIMIAHNHPSGDVSPSQDDRNLTRRLQQAGEIMGIDLLDHLIISPNDFLSFKERGLL